MGHKPAGGLHSRNVGHVSAPKVEPRPHARNPARVAQYGELVGDHITNKSSTGYKGDPDFTRKGYAPPVGPTSFSNVGVGGGRTIYKTGSQCQTGTPDRGEARPQSPRGILNNE
jgi:hypothetical protein